MENLKEQSLKGLSPEELLSSVHGQALTTKKSILEYMDKLKKLSKTTLDEEQLKASYNLIEEAIKAMSEQVKPNTIVYLKNELKTKLGKYSGMQVGRENAFLNFFKETYDTAKKTKEYTWVLADLTKIREQQILDTLKTINTYCFKNKLTQGEKKDIYPMLERIVDTQNVRYINQLKSMEGIRKAFRIKVIEEEKKYKIMKLK